MRSHSALRQRVRSVSDLIRNKVSLVPEGIDRIRVVEIVGLDTVGPAELKQGTNVLVLKVVNEGTCWQGCVRLVDAAGRPAQGIRVRLTQEP